MEDYKGNVILEHGKTIGRTTDGEHIEYFDTPDAQEAKQHIINAKNALISRKDLVKVNADGTFTSYQCGDYLYFININLCGTDVCGK